MRVEYYTLGSRDEGEGLTLYTRTVDDNGNVVVGYQNHDRLYKKKQITKEEYDKLFAELSKATSKGFFGLVNDEGKKEFDRRLAELEAPLKAQREKEQALIAKRLARQLEAGLIDEEDLDTAIRIELPGIPVDQIAALKDQISVIRVKHEVM